MEFYRQSAFGTCNCKDPYRELLENSDRYYEVSYDIFRSVGDNPSEENRQQLSGIPEQSNVHRDSVQTDDLHRAIQYLDEDACGSLHG
ncbi:hypothetical protein K0M31_013662, partial [Melipona bicolor]